MGIVRLDISVSLDGYVAGPNQTVEEPLGQGGEGLHEWAYPLESFRRPHGDEGGEVNASSAVMEEVLAVTGAAVIGRNMFGGQPGPWGVEPWEGWWGEEPPFHYPVFVVTHHQREPLVKQGGTTFTFVTDGVESAVAQAKAAAGQKDVTIGGGAQVAQQCLAAGLVDQMDLHLVPLFLGGGARLFDDLGAVLPKLDQVRVIEAPGVTHLRYRVQPRKA